MKIVDESILFFSRISLSKFSLEALYTSWVQRSINNRVCMECEESVFPKQSGLVTWPRDLIKSRVQAVG